MSSVRGAAPEAAAPAVVALVAAAIAAGCAAITPAPAGIERTTREVEFAGVTTLVDDYLPSGPRRSTVVLAHGFTRHRGTLAGLAASLAQTGHAVVVPDLPFPADQVANARFLAMLARDAPAGMPLIFGGFSAGGLASLLTSADTPRAAGWIGLDPVDRAGLGERAAGRLGVPAMVLRAPPSSCNARGNIAPALARLAKLLEDRVIDGASHCDFESPTDAVCRLACGTEAPERQREFANALAAAVARILDCAGSAAKDCVPLPGRRR